VMARYIKTLPNGMLLVQLASGLMGKVQDRGMTPEQKHLAAQLRPGDPVSCVVASVVTDRLQVLLELRKDPATDPLAVAMGLHMSPTSTRAPSLRSIHPSARGGRTGRENARIRGGRSADPTKPDRYHHRRISHKCWKDISREDAIQLLREGNWMDPIVRPSSLKADAVTVTFVLFQAPPSADGDLPGGPGFYHLDLTEAPHQNTTLWVTGTHGEFVFQDLDEVIATYVGRFLELGDEITRHPKFAWRSEVGITEELERLFREDPSRVHYRIIPDTTVAERSACFQLYFVDKAHDPDQPYKVRHLPVLLSFEGFTLRSVKEGNPHRGPHRKVPALLDAFKRFYMEFKARNSSGRPHRSAALRGEAVPGPHTPVWRGMH